MADPIRLFAEFTDQLGTDYRLNIHESGYGGSAHEFNLGSDGFVLRYSGDNENRMQPIIGSEVTFTLTETVLEHTAMLTALATSEDPDFKVSIFKDPDGANTLFWTGVLLHEQVELQDESYPIQNTMNAVDELGDLKNVLYNNDGSAYTGRDTIVEHLVLLLNKTRALHVYDSNDIFLKYANDFKPTTFLSSNALIELEANHAAFYNVNEAGFVEYMSAFDVLQNFATTFNARVFFADGYFWFVPVGAVFNNVTINVHTVTKAGTVSGSTSAVDTGLVVGTDIVKLRGGTTTFLPPLNKVQRTWVTNNNLPLIGPETQFLNASGQQTALGTAFTDNSLAYDQGTLFRLKFLYTHSFDGDGTSTGSAQHARLILKMSIQVGNLYYKNAVTFGPETMGVGNFENNYDVDLMTFSAPAWSAGAGHFYLAVTPTPNYLNRNNGLFYNFTNFPTNFVSLAYSGEPFSMDLDAIPSIETGINITVNVEGYDFEGNLITDVTGVNADAKLDGFTCDLLSGGLTNGDRVVYEATTTDKNQATLIQDNVLIGSSAFNDIKNLYENNSAPDQPIDSFSSFANSSATFAIHKLGVKEILAGQNYSTKVKRGTVYKGFVSPLNTMKFGSRDFLPFETSFVADAVRTDYESFFLTSSDTNISVPDGQVFDDHTPVDETEPQYDLRNSFTPTDGDMPPNIFQRFLQQPVTGVTNRLGSSYTVSATDQMVMNTWTGANGSSLLYLPSVTNNEGRTVQFHSDGTIAANKFISLRPNPSDSGVTIDGGLSYSFDRSYDGITILCHNSNWFIIQKKEK